MRFHADQFIHQLSTAEILTILAKDAWQTNNQSLTSAITNDNNLIAPDAHWMALGENTSGINAFIDICFDRKVKRILDVGGGRFDCNREFMQKNRGIHLLIWDPFNRSQHHNLNVQQDVTSQQVDAVTSMSVLNVIPEVAVRLAHINTVKKALKIDGKAYFKIWSGDKPLQGSYLASATENSFQANAFADRFLTEIEVVFGVGNVKLESRVGNLIIAKKVSEKNILRNEIVELRKKSFLDSLVFGKLKERSFDKFKCSNLSFSFFRKLENGFLEANRHFDQKIQHEYDKRFGVVKLY